MARAPKYELFEGHNGEWFWHLKGANGEVVASSEGYSSESDAYRGAKDEARIARSTKDPEKPKGS
jgi:uncharacterized protein YegP (UPF0339 family)